MDRNVYFWKEMVQMMFCNNCGQSPYLSDDMFKENRNTSGWEVAYLNPNNGETEDWGDSETCDSDHESYECPVCSSNDVDYETELTSEDALRLRNRYNEQRRVSNAQREEEHKRWELERKAKDASREWDIEVNI